MIGQNDSSALITKLNSNGEIVWQRSHRISSWDSFGNIDSTTDGNFIVVGNSSQNSSEEIIIWKLDSEGNPVWQHHITELPGRLAYGLVIATDGNMMIPNTSLLTSTDSIIRVNSSGTYLSDMRLWSASPFIWNPHPLSVLSEGGVLAAGTNSEENGIVQRIDRSSNVVWTNTFSAIGSGSTNHGMFFSAREVDHSGYIATGSITTVSGQSVWLVRINENGQQLWQHTVRPLGAEESWSQGVAIEPMSNGGFLIAGSARSADGRTHPLLIRVNEDGR